MEVEGRKSNSCPVLTFEAPVKVQYLMNKGKISVGAPPVVKQN